MKKAFVFILIAVFVSSSCEELPENAPTYGQTQVVADETLFPVVDALEKAFEHTYSKASVNVTYLPEVSAFQQFHNDSIFVIVSARRLNATEEQHLKSRNLNPRTAIIANDAIALLVNPNNPDTNLTCEQALQFFRGDATDWSRFNTSNRSGKVNLVFDHQGSSTVSYILSKSGKSSLPANAYELKTTDAVVDYVASHAGALGIIGYSWLSDFDDPQCRKLRSMVEVVAVSPCEDGKSGEFFKPFATNIQEDVYPFSRQVFAINRETNNGLGTGFTAFVAGELGQRIISKTGILPAFKVEHNIELKSEPFKVKK